MSNLIVVSWSFQFRRQYLTSNKTYSFFKAMNTENNLHTILCHCAINARPQNNHLPRTDTVEEIGWRVLAVCEQKVLRILTIQRFMTLKDLYC
jgi:hypothetical protein